MCVVIVYALSAVITVGEVVGTALDAEELASVKASKNLSQSPMHILKGLCITGFEDKNMLDRGSGVMFAWILDVRCSNGFRAETFFGGEWNTDVWFVREKGGVMKEEEGLYAPRL